MSFRDFVNTSKERMDEEGIHGMNLSSALQNYKNMLSTITGYV